MNQVVTSKNNIGSFEYLQLRPFGFQMYDQAKETRTASDRPCIEELCTHPIGIVRKRNVEYKIKVILEKGPNLSGSSSW